MGLYFEGKGNLKTLLENRKKTVPIQTHFPEYLVGFLLSLSLKTFRA
jgi:hypothetical protein